MPVYRDQLNRDVYIAGPPQRIISIVPSQTELLYDLGLDNEVAGITKFCIHPEQWFRSKTRVGGTKQLHTGIIQDLEPDLIIANREENTKEQVEALAAKYPVWISDINTLDDALQMISSTGAITGREKQAYHIIREIEDGFTNLVFDVPPIAAAYLIWKDPYMTIGGDSFISHMMIKAGLLNVFEALQRYPVISLEQIAASGCQYLLLSSEPYPFAQKHLDELKQSLPGINILLVDGELFSWYGSRLVKAPAYFRHLHQQILSLDHAGS